MKNTGRIGVSAVQSIVYNDLKWIFREQLVEDFGIDAEIEVANQKYPTGKMIAIQIKSGDSYFKRTTREGIVFRFDENHKQYWLGHVLPVIVLLYHPVSKECIWEIIDKFTVKQVSRNGYKIVIPKENQFGVFTKAKLLILAYSKNIDDLAKEIDDLDIDKDSVYILLDDKQKKIFDKVRKMIDKKNASSDRVPFEYKREELSDFVGAIEWLGIKDEIYMGGQYKELVDRIDEYIYSSQKNTLIILGEAGIGKTTLVKMFMKNKVKNDILYIQSGHYKNILDRIRNEYEINNNIKVVIIDGWDMLVPGERLITWNELVDWQSEHKDIKVIITSRNMENNIWDDAEFLRIYPLSQVEALEFLKSMAGSNLINDEAAMRLVNIFTSPLMLKMLIMATKQFGIPLEEATRDKLLYILITQYSEEANRTLEDIAFKMMQKNEIIITLTDTRYLKYLSQFKELHIENEQVSFLHKAFYEIFAAKYILRHIFKEEMEPKEFSAAIWDTFANNLCSLEILDYVKFLLKHEKLNEIFLQQLNNNFNYMLERGMLLDSISELGVFKAISNVFYMIWHIVSYANRIYCEIFKPKISESGETNLSCIINIFNKIYFSTMYLDFSHTDLSYVKLWRCNLIDMNFKNSILQHTNFLGSHLGGSNFQQADLSYSNLVAADLRYANLKDAILTGANVGNCIISEDSMKYFLPYKDTLRNVKKMIVFMNDGTIKYSLD